MDYYSITQSHPNEFNESCQSIDYNDIDYLKDHYDQTEEILDKLNPSLMLDENSEDPLYRPPDNVIALTSKVQARRNPLVSWLRRKVRGIEREEGLEISDVSKKLIYSDDDDELDV